MANQMLGVLKRRRARTVIIVMALEDGVFRGSFASVGTDLHECFGLGFAAAGPARPGDRRAARRAESIVGVPSRSSARPPWPSRRWPSSLAACLRKRRA
jgi:hypothetical protein